MKASFIVPLVLALFNTYIALSVRHKLPSGVSVSAFVLVIGVFFLGVQLIAPLFDWSLAPITHTFSGDFYEKMVQTSYFAIGVMSCLMVSLLLVDLLYLFLRFLVPVRVHPIMSLTLLGVGMLGAAASVGTGMRYAGQTEVAPVEVYIKGLPASFDGFKIAQITDVHVGPHLRKEFVQQLVDQITPQEPDLIVLTGDLADGKASALAQSLEPLGTLQAPFGKLYVTGNHEYYWNAREWIDALEKLGFQTLMNDNVVLDRSGGLLLIGGVPDLTALRIPVTPSPDPFAAAQGGTALATKILLSHQPKLVDTAEKAGFQLQISGHTHAGQYFPFTWIIKLFEPYTHGVYNVGELQLFVSKGAGFWGPPLRSGGSGEIALITLRSHQAK